MLTHTHTCIYTNINTHIHTYTHAHTPYIYIYACTPHTHTCTQTCTNRMHTHIYSQHIYTLIHIHSHAHTHICIQTWTHIYIYVHTCTYITILIYTSMHTHTSIHTVGLAIFCQACSVKKPKCPLKGILHWANKKVSSQSQSRYWRTSLGILLSGGRSVKPNAMDDWKICLNSKKKRHKSPQRAHECILVYYQEKEVTKDVHLKSLSCFSAW